MIESRPTSVASDLVIGLRKVDTLANRPEETEWRQTQVLVFVSISIIITLPFITTLHRIIGYCVIDKARFLAGFECQHIEGGIPDKKGE